MGIWPVYKSLSYGVGIRKHVIVVVVLIGKEGGGDGAARVAHARPRGRCCLALQHWGS